MIFKKRNKPEAEPDAAKISRYDGTEQAHARAEQPEPAKAPQVNYAQPDTRSEYDRKANLGFRWEDGTARLTDPYMRWLDRQRRRSHWSAI